MSQQQTILNQQAMAHATHRGQDSAVHPHPTDCVQIDNFGDLLGSKCLRQSMHHHVAALFITTSMRPCWARIRSTAARALSSLRTSSSSGRSAILFLIGNGTQFRNLSPRTENPPQHAA